MTKSYSSNKHPQNVMIAVIDVLGFKELLKNNSIEELSRKYRQLIDIKIISSKVLSIDSVETGYLECGTTIFSDTILMWCRDDIPAIECFIISCCSLMKEALELNLFLRGGISYGKCVIDLDERTFLGTPIADAYLLEQSQDWIGISMDVNAKNRIDSGRINKNGLIEYAAPLKKGKKLNTYVLNWSQFCYAGTKSKIQSAISEDMDAKVRLKFNNTVKFIEYTCDGYHADS